MSVTGNDATNECKYLKLVLYLSLNSKHISAGHVISDCSKCWTSRSSQYRSISSCQQNISTSRVCKRSAQSPVRWLCVTDWEAFVKVTEECWVWAGGPPHLYITVICRLRTTFSNWPQKISKYRFQIGKAGIYLLVPSSQIWSMRLSGIEIWQRSSCLTSWHELSTSPTDYWTLLIFRDEGVLHLKSGHWENCFNFVFGSRHLPPQLKTVNCELISKFEPDLSISGRV